MRKVILRNSLSPGDIVLLTGAVRDLHRSNPGKFQTDVRTPCPELWEHNEYITPLSEDSPDVQVLDCHYPLINRCNEEPLHFIHGFSRFLSEKLEVPIHVEQFKAHVPVSRVEKSWMSQVHELTGQDLPFWILVAGGKSDFTIKWWDARRYQEVVDHFRDRILFVQVGQHDHHHPPLENVLDLRGRTDLRQFVRLMYHAQGVLCPVTFAMHLAAAVETRRGAPPIRPCVVVAGGREPVHWEAYPGHQFLHTIGALNCCAHGGCWKSRTTPLGDGDEKDFPQNLCQDVIGNLPRCMDMITSHEVIGAIDRYFSGGSLSYLNDDERRVARASIKQQIPSKEEVHDAHLAPTTTL